MRKRTTGCLDYFAAGEDFPANNIPVTSLTQKIFLCQFATGPQKKRQSASHSVHSQKDPTKPIIPLAALPPAKRQLDADFIDSISDALGLGNIKPRDRIRHGHRNLSTCSLTSVVAANWSGAYKYAKDITEQVGDEVKNGWVELPLPVPSTWPFRLEQQNGISQGLKENGDPKVRRATDKGHGPDSVNECIELVSKLKLCTNLQIGRGAAILATADEGPRATPNDDEDPNDPSTVARRHAHVSMENRSYGGVSSSDASLSRRVAIIAGYFRRCTRFLGGRGGSERTPRVRPLDRPTDYLTDRRCARASLSWRDRPSPRGGCCGRVRQPRRPYPAHAHRHELVMRCACRRAAAAVVARGRRARTCAQTALSSCPFTDVESMIIIVT